MSTRPSVTDTAGGRAGTCTYLLRVAGHLDDHWSDWLGGHRLVRTDACTTELVLESVDQAGLHGVLAGIRDLGATLLSLHRVE
jgi:hypothetical protein